MPHLVAAVDDSAATGPVVALGQWFAALLEVDVVAMYVSEDGDGVTARAVAERAGVRFELQRGDPVTVLSELATRPDVSAVAIGARALPAQKMPAGHVALGLISTIDKPVMVVPPDARIPSDTRVRVLAPVDDDPRSVPPLRRLLDQMHIPDLELVLLRVFDAEHMPSFQDHAGYDTDIFVKELVRRTAPDRSAQARVECRVGEVAHTILAAERELASDVVVLGWGRDLTAHRAAVVKRLLAHSRTPLILVPASSAIDATARAGAGPAR